jgi:hypothetical protein
MDDLEDIADEIVAVWNAKPSCFVAMPYHGVVLLKDFDNPLVCGVVAVALSSRVLNSSDISASVAV